MYTGGRIFQKLIPVPNDHGGCCGCIAELFIIGLVIWLFFSVLAFIWPYLVGAVVVGLVIWVIMIFIRA